MLILYLLRVSMYDFEDEIKLKGGRICNPVKTLYSKIMYKYAQFNEMKTFPHFRDYN